MAKIGRRKPGGGRKPKGELHGNAGNLTIRITSEIRKELERAAVKNNRSLSQETQLRIKHSFNKGHLDKIFDAKHVMAFAYLIGKFTNSIEIVCKQKWKKDRYAYLALRAGISVLLENLAPQGEVKPPSWVQSLSKEENPYAELIMKNHQSPEQVGIGLALGLVGQLGTYEEPHDVPEGTSYAEEFYQLPKIREVLERDD